MHIGSHRRRRPRPEKHVTRGEREGKEWRQNKRREREKESSCALIEFPACQSREWRHTAGGRGGGGGKEEKEGGNQVKELRGPIDPIRCKNYPPKNLILDCFHEFDRVSQQKRRHRAAAQFQRLFYSVLSPSKQTGDGRERETKMNGRRFSGKSHNSSLFPPSSTPARCCGPSFPSLPTREGKEEEERKSLF